MTDTFRSTAPDRKQAATNERARMEGFTQGYAAGTQDAPFVMSPTLIAAYKACKDAGWNREKRVNALLNLEDVLKGLIEGDVS